MPVLSTPMDPAGQDPRKRRTMVLALVHGALAVLFLVGFIAVQMHRG